MKFFWLLPLIAILFISVPLSDNGTKRAVTPPPSENPVFEPADAKCPQPSKLPPEGL